MLAATPECARPYLLIQRLVDQDLLGETEAAVLLSYADSARGSLQAGDEQVARHQVESVGEFIRALVANANLFMSRREAETQ